MAFMSVDFCVPCDVCVCVPKSRWYAALRYGDGGVVLVLVVG